MKSAQSDTHFGSTANWRLPTANFVAFLSILFLATAAGAQTGAGLEALKARADAGDPAAQILVGKIVNVKCVSIRPHSVLIEIQDVPGQHELTLAD
jgi:hypothetical protein